MDQFGDEKNCLWGKKSWLSGANLLLQIDGNSTTWESTLKPTNGTHVREYCGLVASVLQKLPYTFDRLDMGKKNEFEILSAALAESGPLDFPSEKKIFFDYLPIKRV